MIRQVALPADPFRLASALLGRPGLAVLASSPGSGLRPRDARFSFVACEPIGTTDDLLPPTLPFEPGFAGASAAPRWIGALPYEAFRGLERTHADRRAMVRVTKPRWHRYDAVIRVDHESGIVAIEADDLAASDRLLRAVSGKTHAGEVSLTIRDAELPSVHEARIRAALDYIAAGDVYQINLARQLRFTLEGWPFALFAGLAGKARAPYGVYWEMDDELTVCATSPELALEVRGSSLRTAPIKGTRPRGTHAAEDRAYRVELEASDKERAELVMAIDLHRNDLGRVADTGSVRVLGEPRTAMSPTVWSRVAEVVARRAVASDLSSVVSALLPCGSVTGAPKVRAMEIIAELEAHRRGLYTGAIGYVGRDGSLTLAMAIRTALCTREGSCWDVEYFAGGGIVCGSDPAREVDETNWKAVHLTKLGRMRTDKR